MSHLSPEDVVPRLRDDLNATPPPVGTGADVIRVGPIGAPDTMQMHGFEFSIARMLDGKRTVHDVIENCERLGLPMDLRSLEGFLHQLQSHSLISRTPPPTGTWSGQRYRTTWSDHQRSLYTQALRSARRGDLAIARQRVAELLWIAPATPEALRLQDLLDEGLEEDPERFQRVFHDVEESWRAEPIDDDAHRDRSWVRPLIIVGLALAVAAAVTLVPLPRMISASARIYPLSEVPVLTTSEGVVKSVAVREGDTVAAGAELFAWDDDDLRIRLAEVRGELEDARRPLREALSRLPDYRPLVAKLHGAEAELTRAQAALLAGQKQGADPKLEADFKRADARAKQLRGELDGVVAVDSPSVKRIQALTEEVSRLEDQRAHPSVRAAVPGVVKELNVRPGQAVGAQHKALQLDDLEHLKLVAVVLPNAARSIREGEQVTVKAGQTTVTGRVQQVSEYQVITSFPNPGALTPGSMRVELKFQPESIWRQLR